MNRQPLLLAILGAVMAASLFFASLLQVLVVKFPTDWEVTKIEQLLDDHTTLSAAQQKSLKRSLGWIRSNHSDLAVRHSRLFGIAAVGFLVLTAMFSLLAFVLWSRHRVKSITPPAGELKRVRRDATSQ